jgi:hypothetical protein
VLILIQRTGGGRAMGGGENSTGEQQRGADSQRTAGGPSSAVMHGAASSLRRGVRNRAPVHCLLGLLWLRTNQINSTSSPIHKTVKLEQIGHIDLEVHALGEPRL